MAKVSFYTRALVGCKVRVSLRDKTEVIGILSEFYEKTRVIVIKDAIHFIPIKNENKHISGNWYKFFIINSTDWKYLQVLEESVEVTPAISSAYT